MFLKNVKYTHDGIVDVIKNI